MLRIDSSRSRLGFGEAGAKRYGCPCQCVSVCMSVRAHLPWLQEEVSEFSFINERWSSEKRAEQAHWELCNSHTSGGPRVSVSEIETR